MQVYKLNEMKHGWYVGNFAPTAFLTPEFEVGILDHPANSVWPTHYHKVATEINLLVSGKMKIQGKQLVTGDVFVLEPGEVANPEFLEDCKLVVIKTPSLPGDKYIVE